MSTRRRLHPSIAVALTTTVLLSLTACGEDPPPAARAAARPSCPGGTIPCS